MGACLQNLTGKIKWASTKSIWTKKKNKIQLNLKKKIKKGDLGQSIWSATVRHKGLHNFLVSFSSF